MSDEIAVPISWPSMEDRRGIVERSMITRLSFLEKQLAAAQQSEQTAHQALYTIARHLFPEADPLQLEETDSEVIIAELKRRGITNGKAGAE